MKTRKMINVKINNEETFFNTIKEVRHFIREDVWDMTRASDNPDATETANKIWNLNVGESINVLDFNIKVISREERI
nr:hypothetical protein [uncultured Mediterranean phage uvMED]